MKWQTHAELNIVTLRGKKEAQNLVQRRKGTINILLSRIEMTSCHLNILSIIKKNKCLFFKTEHKYQAIINSSKLVVRDKPSKQTTKAHTISNRKGNKKYFASPVQKQTAEINVPLLCRADTESTKITDSPAFNKTSDGRVGWKAVHLRVHILLKVSQSPLSSPSHDDPPMASGRFELGATLGKVVAVWNPA